MNTYRITEEWKEFQKFRIEYLNHFKEASICFMSNSNTNDIYIRYSDDRIGEIIGGRYTLTPSDAPVAHMNDGWTFTGNPELFTK
jgi:hypothetical protein